MSWLEIKSLKKPLNDNINISSEIIWNNTNLKISNQVYFFEKWFQNGIKYLNDIFDYQNQRFYHYIDLTIKFDILITDFLKYMSLIASIPAEWKTKIKNENNRIELNKTLLFKLKKSKQKNKLLYNFQFNANENLIIPSRVKWTEEFENTNLTWNIILNSNISSTLDVKLRNFQYKYILRITTTNKRLFKQNIVNCNLCDFCSMYIESLKHLFWEYNHIQIFWNRLDQFLKSCNIFINLNFQTISFGVSDYSFTDNNMYNFILFHAKYFIFINKCHKTIPSCENFKRYLLSKIEIEKQISLMNDQLQKYERKWRQFIIYL